MISLLRSLKKRIWEHWMRPCFACCFRGFPWKKTRRVHKVHGLCPFWSEQRCDLVSSLKCQCCAPNRIAAFVGSATNRAGHSRPSEQALPRFFLSRVRTLLTLLCEENHSKNFLPILRKAPSSERISSFTGNWCSNNQHKISASRKRELWPGPAAKEFYLYVYILHDFYAHPQLYLPLANLQAKYLYAPVDSQCALGKFPRKRFLY